MLWGRGGTNWKAQAYDLDGWKAGCMTNDPRGPIPLSPPKQIGFKFNCFFYLVLIFVKNKKLKT